MKHLLYFFISAIFCFITFSCSSYTTFTVQAPPGTEILTPAKTRLAVANQRGAATIKMSDDDYYSFLLSHNPNSEDYVPFALDYKKKSYLGTTVQEWGGWVTSVGGALAAVIGLIGGPDDLAPLIASGSGVSLVGLAFGLPANSRNSQTNHEYQYKYLAHQNSNQDIAFTKPVLEVTRPTTPEAPSTGTRVNVPVANQDQPVVAGSSVSAKRIPSSASAKKLKDNASIVEGIYTGTGELTLNKSVIEKYEGISVVIKKSSENVVLVNVVESNGEQFFITDGEYTVKKLSNGTYELRMKEIDSAKITIDTKKNLIYIHPRVNIEGDIYSLSVKAKYDSPIKL